MIYFVAPHDQTFGIEAYLQQVGQSMQGRLVVRTYEDLIAERALPLGSYVFAALDQLTVTETELVARIWTTLAAAGAPRLLNDPRRVMCRYELLTTAHARGRNRFRAFRADDIPADLRFPAFLRVEREHTGSLTRLLDDARALRRGLWRLRLKGYRRRDLLVVEYCDTADPSGLLRKHSAYAVGERIIPCALVVSANWVTKSEGRRLDEATAREELEYVRSNPHAEWLRETFALARIDYGRIDYGVCDGQPQVWEINLNPTVGRRPGHPSHMTDAQRRLRAPAREHVGAQLAAAWTALDLPAPSRPPVRLEVTAEELRRLEAERRARRRVEAQRASRARLADTPPVALLRKAWRSLQHA